MIDRDITELYEVSTKRLNEQVKRNLERFPEDFMFQLTLEEGRSRLTSRSQNATLRRGQNVKYARKGARTLESQEPFATVRFPGS